MRTIRKSLLLAFIVATGFSISSCSKDKEDDLVINPPNETTEMGFVSLQLMAGSDIGSKAEDNVAVGTAGEQKVSKIRFVYYDANTMIAEYAFTYEAIHSTGSDFLGANMFDPNDSKWGGENFNYTPGLEASSNIIKFMPKAELVQIKPYKLLVLVNPNDEAIAATKAKYEKKGVKDANNGRPTAGDSIYNSIATNFTHFNEIKASIGTSGNNLSAFIGEDKANYKDNPDYFFMSNQQGLVDVPVTKIWKTEKEAYPSGNRLQVPVDRLVSKVTLRADYDKVSELSGATVSDGSWKLDVTNLSTYYLRHQAPIAGGGTENAGTPRVKMYAIDTNYDMYSWERYLFKNIDPKTITGLLTPEKVDLKKHFNYVETSLFASADNVNALGTYTHPGADDNWMGHVSEYALENTMAADEQYEDVTTAAVLKIKYFPEVSALGTTLGDGAKYYVWFGYVLAAEDMEMIRDFNPKDETIENPEKYEMFLTLQNYLKANNTEGLNFTAKWGAKFDSFPTTSESHGDIDVNVDGVNYYRLLIRHFNNSLEPQTMGYGRYGIVRNNWYRMTLTKLNGPGSIGVPTHKGPDDKDNYNVAAEVEVLPWVVRDQEAIGGGWY
ncbi:Mfa1 family fimbria major subunit [Parabacteroides sp. OttesenSCG-928-G06]|nr:Mfa1 family fimbria major subunit [Parabacteroides sp. OttesenSCG-928-K15]MDL2281734.1 Mfa1 family fimbria major subunit [Parabacteroides sp. OttesenSCG-928-G06]